MIELNNKSIPAFYIGNKSATHIYYNGELVWLLMSLAFETDFVYRIAENSVYLIYYIGNKQAVEILNSIQNKPVTVIGPTAFCYSGIKSAVVPDTVTEIM